MKKLKYIKLFEAFNSSMISGTLKYIKSSDRDEFLTDLKNLCGIFDYPLSDISDDSFDYLPYNLALNARPDKSKSKCDYESQWISGEFCKDGKVNRTWGKGKRVVDCPKCKGTGLIDESVGEIIIFWFSVDGEYLKTSGSGEKVENKSPIRHEDVLELKTGDKILIKFYPHTEPVDSVIFRDEYNNIFVIQDSQEGGSSSYTNDWKKFGRYSWCINSRGAYDEIYVTDVGHSDLYNVRISNKIVRTPFRDPKNAHFALILDLQKLKSKEHRSLSDTKQKRIEGRIGASALKSDKEIRDANLNRYVDELVKKHNIKGDSIGELNKIIYRIMGYSNGLTLLLYGVVLSSISDILEDFYYLKKSEGIESDENYYLEIIEGKLPKYYKESNRYSSNVNSNMKKLEKECETRGEKYIKFYKLWVECSNLLFNKIKEYDIESISDVDVLIQQLKGLNKLSNERRGYIEYSFTSSLTNNSTSTIAWSIGDIDRAIESIEIIKKYIQKTF